MVVVWLSAFSRARHGLVACFLALDTGFRVHVFPRLTPDACFPALDSGCILSRA